jgi:hypothetical protein
MFVADMEGKNANIKAISKAMAEANVLLHARPYGDPGTTVIARKARHQASCCRSRHVKRASRNTHAQPQPTTVEAATHKFEAHNSGRIHAGSLHRIHL